MFKFKIGDVVLYDSENTKNEICDVIALTKNGYVIETESTWGGEHPIYEVKEEDICICSQYAFRNLSSEAQQNALMHTMQRCQEVFAALESEGKIDSEKVGSIDWFDESKFKIKLCREYEETYCGTDMYEENYSDSTEQFFRVKLLERFGIEEGGEQ